MARSDTGAGKLDTSGQVGIVFQPNGQFALLQAAEGGSIKLVHHDRHVDTVTVVAFPSGFLTTLPHFQSPSVAPDSITLDVSPSTSPLSSPTLSSPSTAPSSSLEVSSSQPVSTLDTSTSPAEIPITSRPPSLPSSIHITHNTSAAPSPGSALTSKVPAYVGTAFGSLVAFATNAAELPWAQRKNGDRGSDWNAGPNLMPASTKASTDRDVGEPRRSDGYGGPPDSLHGTHLTGGAGLETMFDGSAPHGHKPTLGRHLPSHLVDKEFSALAMPPVVGQIGEEGEPGTPREDVVVPRYLSLKGDALELPLGSQS
ncbi:hypothetical protein FA13DRAFT_1789729 [Coprinellus micaceus]|uniref:Uncharacterized protein n=1 Tax=Coprinellus micaceus TaxID=71717 RepID=A0A4Y7TK97_COPMI|nr:hypothetical protein FA13DRAFT_1789729 [Coprinellus micaceus]